MRLTALLPPPPTPITLIFAKSDIELPPLIVIYRINIRPNVSIYILTIL